MLNLRGSLDRKRSSLPVNVMNERMSRDLQILLAEDNDGDVFLVRRALDKNHVPYILTVARNGEDAWRILETASRLDSGDVPDLILLDLNLPRFDGEQILTWLREQDSLREVPIIVLTSSDSQRDRDKAMMLGARIYFRKPTDLHSFMDLGRVVADLMESERKRHLEATH